MRVIEEIYWFEVALSIFTLPIYLIALYKIKQSPNIPQQIMIMWFAGAIQGFFQVITTILVLKPEYFNTYWGTFVVWITLTAAGVVHWSFALEYETSSLIMIKKLEVDGKSVG